MVFETLATFDLTNSCPDMKHVRFISWDTIMKVAMPRLKISAAVFASFIILGGGVVTFYPLSQNVSAQHHGAPPPAAAVGDRKIILDMQTEPKNVTQSDDDVLMLIGFLDEGKNAKIQHVTFRIDISKDGKHIFSDFFHDHNGEVRLMFKDKDGSSSNPTIGGNQDVLTNAWIADPGSPISINGPIFNQSGTYNIGVELTTIDNDKTDLTDPLIYNSELNIS